MTWVSEEFEQVVRERAYFLWEQDGRPVDREHEYWFRAMDQCLRESALGGIVPSPSSPEAVPLASEEKP